MFILFVMTFKRGNKIYILIKEGLNVQQWKVIACIFPLKTRLATNVSYKHHKYTTQLRYRTCFDYKIDALHILLFIKPSFSTFLSFKCWHIFNSIYNSAPQQRSNVMLFRCGWLAQLGEHRPYKARVTGSSPVSPTTFKSVRI